MLACTDRWVQDCSVARSRVRIEELLYKKAQLGKTLKLCRKIWEDMLKFHWNSPSPSTQLVFYGKDMLIFQNMVVFEIWCEIKLGNLLKNCTKYPSTVHEQLIFRCLEWMPCTFLSGSHIDGHKITFSFSFSCSACFQNQVVVYYGSGVHRSALGARPSVVPQSGLWSSQPPLWPSADVLRPSPCVLHRDPLSLCGDTH